MNFDSCADQGFRLLGTGNTASAQAIWNNTPLDLSVGFTANFSIRFSNFGGSGADGTCFVLQSMGPNALGGTGGNLGYAWPSITPSLAVEFDIFDNGNGRADIAANHTSVVYGGAMNLPADGPTAVGNLEDSDWHTVQVIWDPCVPVFDVFIDDLHPVHLEEDIVANAFGGNPNNVLWGFTAGKASSSADHDVCVGPIQIHPPCCETGLCKVIADLTECIEEGDWGDISLICEADFDWTFPAGSTAIELNGNGHSSVVNASAGTYQVVITYPDGCTEEYEFEVVEDCCEEPECPTPTNLQCVVPLSGETELRWDPVDGACGYIVNFNPSDAACGCDEGNPPFAVGTFATSIPIPPTAGKCFSWNVQTRCCDGTLSTPSPNTCFNEFTNCLFEGLIEDNPNESTGSTPKTSIYPNPSNGSINIELNLDEETMVSIGIFDNTGKLVEQVSEEFVYTGKYSKAWTFGDQIQNGIYFVKIIYGNGDMDVQKVIVQK